MKKNIEPCYYGDYLQLDKILGAQELQSEKYGDAAHEEMLFIIVHQVYELWFKQVLHELNAVIDTFNQETVKDQQLTLVASLTASHANSKVNERSNCNHGNHDATAVSVV